MIVDHWANIQSPDKCPSNQFVSQVCDFWTQCHKRLHLLPNDPQDMLLMLKFICKVSAHPYKPKLHGVCKHNSLEILFL